MKITLRLAAIYNLLWGAWVIIFPQQFFALSGMELINHSTIWQGMGMVIGVYGLGYWWASYHPLRHWPVVAVGMLGKFFGPIGFVMNYLQGLIPFEFIYMIIPNDLIWWWPFGYILWKVHVHKKWALSE